MTAQGVPLRRTPSPWVVVIALLLLYVMSFLDRVIINMMVEPIQRDLDITDFQMSLLQGPAFGIFYVFSGLALGYLVDRYSKRMITLGGVAIWGSATTLSGFASNFGQLAVGRMGVGVGESVLTPAAHAIISETFPREKLATAMSIYTMGAIFGGAIAMAVGGFVVHFTTTGSVPTLPLVGDLRGWQAVFLFVGLGTLILLPLVFFIPKHIKAPTRVMAGGDAGGHPAGDSSSATSAAPQGFLDLIRKHWRLYILLPVGFGCTNILVNAYSAWHPTFMARAYGMEMNDVGYMLGGQHLIAGVIGQVGGAMVVDWLYRRGVMDAHVKFQMVGIVISVPLMVAALNAPTPWLFIVLSFAFYCLCYPFVAYAAAALQLFTPTHLRGRVSALFLALVTLVGSLLGATATGWLTDNYFGDKARLGDSMVIVTVVVTPFILGILWLAGREMTRMHGEGGVRTGIGSH